MRSKMMFSCVLNERVNCRELTRKSLKIRSSYNRILSSSGKIFRNLSFLEHYFTKFVGSDELCRHGDVLTSSALAYTLNNLTAAVDALRQDKLQKEQPEEDLESKEAATATTATSGTIQQFRFNFVCSFRADFYREWTQFQPRDVPRRSVRVHRSYWTQHGESRVHHRAAVDGHGWSADALWQLVLPAERNVPLGLA